MLPFMSLKIRYPGLTSGKLPTSGKDGVAEGGDNLYEFTYHFFKEWSSELEQFDFNRNMEMVKKKASTDLVDGDEGMVHLDGEK